MIFKIQRAITSNIQSPPCLVYNEDRSILFEMPLLPELEELFGEDYKIYIKSNAADPYKVELRESLIIGERVADQDW